MKAKKWATTHVQDATLIEAVPITVLTNLLMLTKDPEALGFDTLGSGCYGTVYAHPRTPGVVYKIACATHSSTMVSGGCMFQNRRMPTTFHRTSADGFAVWANLCIDYQRQFGDMPFLPKFYKVQHSPGLSVYAMEELDSFDDGDNDPGAYASTTAFAELLGISPRFEDDAWEFPDDLLDDLAQFAMWLKRQLPKDFDSWDIHSGNVMLRDGCPVLTDPWSGINPHQRPVSLNRRLSASLGVPA